MTRRRHADAPGVPGSAACHVYGVLSADTRLPAGLVGTGGHAVSLVRRGDLAGAVSALPVSGALGTREELRAHECVVASLAAATTVLPLRFGALVTTPEAVAGELLGPYHDWLAAGLANLAGKAQFSVSGCYVEETVLREVLMEERQVLELRESLRGVREEDAYYELLRLGELIVHALDAKREADTDDLRRSLAPFAAEVVPRPPTGQDTAVDAAFLVAAEDRAGFGHAVDELGYRWAGRVRLRVLGPLPPYDFVPPPPGGDGEV
jgi:Gas vesicle synthesis protein GvpL/GvpF